MWRCEDMSRIGYHPYHWTLCFSWNRKCWSEYTICIWSAPWTDWFKRKSPGNHDWLVVELAYPPEEWWTESQLGWWHSQYYMENNKSHVPNHQPDELFSTSSIVVLSYFSPKPIQWARNLSMMSMAKTYKVVPPQLEVGLWTIISIYIYLPGIP